MELTRQQALDLLMKYNKESFHILHGLTVEGVMRYFAQELGYGEDTDFWGLCGLLHDVDYEMSTGKHTEILEISGMNQASLEYFVQHYGKTYRYLSFLNAS